VEKSSPGRKYTTPRRLSLTPREPSKEMNLAEGLAQGRGRGKKVAYPVYLKENPLFLFFWGGKIVKNAWNSSRKSEKKE